jgi:hypothetical protein
MWFLYCKYLNISKCRQSIPQLTKQMFCVGDETNATTKERRIKKDVECFVIAVAVVPSSSPNQKRFEALLVIFISLYQLCTVMRAGGVTL